MTLDKKKILSKEHRKNISLGLLRASAEGRMPAPKPEVIAKGLAAIAALKPEARKRRDIKSGLTMKGRPQVAEKTASGPKHHSAKAYVVKSPDGVVYSFRNMVCFVRDHPHLFEDRDVLWLKSPNGRQPWCRAKNGLASLFREKKPLYEWKGWTAVPLKTC